MSIENPRRFYQLKSKAAARMLETALAQTWRAKQLELPGEALADDFPSRTRLADAGYLAREDLAGVTCEELQQAGLTMREAAAVIAAL